MWQTRCGYARAEKTARSAGRGASRNSSGGQAHARHPHRRQHNLIVGNTDDTPTGRAQNRNTKILLRPR